jgi:hypothetical protein
MTTLIGTDALLDRIEKLEAELYAMTEDRNIVLETSQQQFIHTVELEAKLAKAVEVLIVYESNLFSFATATDDTADEAEIFLDRDRGKLARNVLAEIKGETE